MKHTLILRNAGIKETAANLILGCPLEPVHKVKIEEYKSKRTLDQNAKMWAMLTDISKQVVWYGKKLIPEEWKDVLTAGLKKQVAVPAIDTGFVILGANTSKMTVKDMIDLIDLAYAFGNEHEVRWTEPEPNGSTNISQK